MIVDFIGIGAARSGTTWLFYSLGQHPAICLSEPKEVLYFNKQSFSNRVNNNPDKTNKNYGKPLSWYMNHFSHCPADSIKGEFSPAYFYDLNAPSNIKRQFPDIKLILNLRNPVDRIHSAYWYRREYGKNEKKSFEYMVKNDKEFVSKGFCSIHLRRYLQVYDRNKIKINIFDDIMDSPRRVLVENLAFLGLNSDFEFNLKDVPKNSAKSSRIGYVINLMGKFSGLLINLNQSRMLKILRKVGLKELVFKLNTKPLRYPEMDEEIKNYLGDIFKEDIEILEDLTGIELARWKI